MKQSIQIGTVIKVNYEAGTVDLSFPDKDNFICFDVALLDTVYKMPNLNDQVLVVFLEDNTQGFVIGRPYNDKNKPSLTGKNIYENNMNQKCKIKAVDGTISIQADSIEFNGKTMF